MMKMNRYEQMVVWERLKGGGIRESEVPAEGMSAEVVKSNQRIYINLQVISDRYLNRYLTLSQFFLPPPPTH